MAKKVTMQLIADYLGVSKYVVSRALAGKDGVSEQTRERVIKAASDLGYLSQTKNTNQIMLTNDVDIQGKQTILVLLQNVRYQTKESSYWGKIFKGVSEAIEKLGLGMVVITESNLENLAKVINPKGYVGVITIGLVTTNLLLEVNQLNIPIVMIDHEDPLIVCDSVFNNNFDASAKITNYLIGLGHRDIQFVGNISYARSFYDRWLGYRSAIELTNKNLSIDKSLSLINHREFKKEFNAWLKKRETISKIPTSFVCANDQIARSVIISLNEHGWEVPTDVSVTGFDNKEESYKDKPTVTTVNVPKKKLGIRGVEILVRRLEERDAPYEKVLLEGEIILRESTAKL